MKYKVMLFISVLTAQFLCLANAQDLTFRATDFEPSSTAPSIPAHIDFSFDYDFDFFTNELYLTSLQITVGETTFSVEDVRTQEVFDSLALLH